MRCKEALLALTLVCAPFLNADSDAKPARYENNSAYQYVAVGSTGTIINNTGFDFGGAMQNLESEQSDVDASWKSLRTFELRRATNKPLKVYVETHAQDTPLFKARYVQYVRDGLDAWSEALDGRLKYEFVDSPARAQIRVKWVSGFSIPDQAGETEYTIGDATVMIQTRDMPDNILKGNIIHELGHALGIGEHSDNGHDIMTAVRSWSSYEEYKNHQPKLTMRDKQAIQRLYGTQWHKGEDLYRAVAVSKPIQVANNNSANAIATGRNQAFVKVQPVKK